MESLAFLERPAQANPLPVYAVYGDESFLKRQVLSALRQIVFGKDGEELGLSTYAGDQAEFHAIRAELETLPLIGTRRLVIVENADLSVRNADSFLTKYRNALEKYVGQPASTGTLVLELKSWPSNTKLYKLLGPSAAISCKALAAHKLPDWCVKWAETHGKSITLPAARLLVDLAGPDMGQLDQELTKLAIYAGKADKIEPADVDRLVGKSRAAETFKIFDAIAENRPAEALRILNRLFEQHEDPVKTLGAFSWQLRRLAQASRIAQQGKPLGAALTQVGVPAFFLPGCEKQLRHLGRQRANHLYHWLLEADLGLKGASQLPPKTVLEQLIVRLS